jgi:hypothetical protein
MPVVINEFDVLPEAPPEARPPAAEQGGGAAPSKAIEPCALASAQRVLHVGTLRVWAH